MESKTILTKCQYCGKELKVKKALVLGHTLTIGIEPCTCKQAQLEQKKQQEQERLEQLEEKRQHKIKLEKERVACGVPKRYLNAKTPNAARLAKECLDGKSVYICGKVGVGKTYYASSICNELQSLKISQHKTGLKFKMLTSIELLNEFKSCFHTNKDETKVTKSLVDVPVLVIDDLGKENPTDWACERLFEIVNARYNDMKSTIITSQYDFNGLTNRLARGGDTTNADAIVSRLYEDCNILNLKGNNKRTFKANFETVDNY